MPWGILITEVVNYIILNVPKNGTILDLLCGTGYLVGEIKKKRPDIQCLGVDLEKEYINYAKKQYPDIRFEVSDVLIWKSKNKFDCVLCTGGLHHIPYHRQEQLIQKISSLTNEKGFAIMADPYIDNYSNERERKLSAVKLGYEYLVATIKNKATDDVILATESLIANDLFLIEFKTSIKKIEKSFIKHFSMIEKHKTWPKKNTEYGDYYFILKNL